MSKAKKTLILSEETPPMIGSVPFVLGNLLRYFPKGSFYILTSSLKGARYGLDQKSTLDCEYFFCELPEFLIRRKGSRFLSPFYEFLRVPLIVLKGVRIFRDNKIDNIFTATHGGFELSAFLIHKLTRKPLFVYLFDIYEEGQVDKFRKLIARLLEKRLFHVASQIFVMSEHLQSHIHSKYGIATQLIPHPVDLSLGYDILTGNAASGKRHTKRIVYTGMVTLAHLDALLHMVRVVNSLDDRNVEFLIYSPRPPERLTQMGIAGERVTCRFAHKSEIPSIQRDADILFLPLAFDSPYPDLIKTASPSKMPEYLAAGRPILIHAPEYSYIAHYARERGFGMVVDRPDPEELKRALLLLLEDESLRKRVVLNALKTVQNHDARKVSGRLQGYLC